MSDITVINDSQQSELVTNGLAKNGELYLKAAGSTNEGAIVVYDSGSWRTFTNEAASFSNGSSVSFDGTNDYGGSLPIPRNGGASWTTTTPITMSAWVKVNSFGLDDAVFGISRHNVDGTRNASFAGGASGLHMLSSGFYLHQSGNQNNLTGTFSTGVWYHIAWTWDGTNAVVYVDGSSNKTFTDTSNGFNTNMCVFVGGGGRWNGYADCVVDEVSFWDSALTAANVSTLYNSGTPGDVSSLSPLVWYRMGDGTEAGSGTEIFDMSGTTRSSGTFGNEASLKLFNGPTYGTDTP